MKIGSHRLSHSVNKKSEELKSKTVENEPGKSLTQKEVKEEKTEQPNPQPNQSMVGRKKFERVQTGLMKKINLHNRLQNNQDTSVNQNTWKKAEPNKGSQESLQNNSGQQNTVNQNPWKWTAPSKGFNRPTWKKAEPNKGSQENVQNNSVSSQQDNVKQNTWKKAEPGKDLNQNTWKMSEQRQETVQNNSVSGQQDQNIEVKRPRAFGQGESTLEGLKGARPRAYGHGESTLPEPALDLEGKKPIEQSEQHSRLTSIFESKEDDLKETAPESLKSYRDTLEAPLSNNPQERELQFQNAREALKKLSDEAGGMNGIEGEMKLLEDTMKDRNLMDSAYVVSVNHAMELKRLGLQPSVAGRVGKFQDVNLETDMKFLGAGALSKVYVGTYTLPDGKSFKGVFKPQELKNMGVRDTGIAENSPRLAYRNVATTRLDDVLGFGLVTRTEMAIHNNTLGTVQEWFEGKSPFNNRIMLEGAKSHDRDAFSFVNENDSTLTFERKIKEKEYVRDEFTFKNGKAIEITQGANNGRNEMNFDDPNLRRDLVRLQLMDAISGQVDRHFGNYIVKRDDNGNYLGLKGIDNDLAWGKDTKTLDQLAKIEGYNGMKHLPPVVDQETYDSFMKLTPKTFSNRMGGLLTMDEIDSAKSRLQEVQDHLEGLKKDGRVIGSKDWGSQQVTGWLMEQKEGNFTNYIAREIRGQEYARELGLLVPFKPKN